MLSKGNELAYRGFLPIIYGNSTSSFCCVFMVWYIPGVLGGLSKGLQKAPWGHWEVLGRSEGSKRSSLGGLGHCGLSGPGASQVAVVLYIAAQHLCAGVYACDVQL